MAPWPAFTLSRAFAPAFERAFADRFGGRDLLVATAPRRAAARVLGVSRLPTVLPGRDGWYYWLGEDAQVARSSLPRHAARAAGGDRRNRGASSSAAASGSPSAASPTWSWWCRRSTRSTPSICPPWVAPSQGPTPLDRLRAAVTADGRVDFLDLRPALRAAKAARARLLQDRLALELQRRDRRVRGADGSRAEGAAGGSLPAIAPPRAARLTCRA